MHLLGFSTKPHSSVDSSCTSGASDCAIACRTFFQVLCLVVGTEIYIRPSTLLRIRNLKEPLMECHVKFIDGVEGERER